MLTKNQQLWVDALRSGDYKQGQGALKINGTYCCLGVASDVLDLPGFKSRDYCPGMLWADTKAKLSIKEQAGVFCLADLVSPWKEKLEAVLEDNQDASSLVILNDFLKWDFLTIAKFIEDNAGALFNAN